MVSACADVACLILVDDRCCEVWMHHQGWPALKQFEFFEATSRSGGSAISTLDRFVNVHRLAYARAHPGITNIMSLRSSMYRCSM